MRNQITGVLIDPENGIAEVRTIEDSLDSFYVTLHCDLIDITSRTIGMDRYTIVCDDEGLLKDGNFATAFGMSNEPMLVGALFVCKDGPNGELASLTDEEAEHVLSYTMEVWGVRDDRMHVWTILTSVGY